jgi:hypothetical protein
VFKRTAFVNDYFLFLHNSAGYLPFHGNNVPVFFMIQKVKGKKTDGEINIERETEEE